MTVESNNFEQVPSSGFEDPVTRVSYIDNVWVRQLHYRKAGDKNTPHTHKHDHASLLASGSVKLTVNGEETFFQAPAMILVLKDHLHHFEALEDNTLVYCVHGIREDEGSGPIVDGDMIPKGLSSETLNQKYGTFAL